MKELIHSDDRVRVDEHGRALLVPGFDGNRYGLIQLQAAMMDGLIDEMGGHQLCQTGGWKLQMGCRFSQNGAGVGIHQHISRHVRQGRRERSGFVARGAVGSWGGAGRCGGSADFAGVGRRGHAFIGRCG